jgi:hypothetical protein
MLSALSAADLAAPFSYGLSDIEIGFCLCGCGQRTPIATRTNRSKGVVKGFPLRFISGHNLRGTGRTANDRPHQNLAARFWLLNEVHSMGLLGLFSPSFSPAPRSPRSSMETHGVSG